MRPLRVTRLASCTVPMLYDLGEIVSSEASCHEMRRRMVCGGCHLLKTGPRGRVINSAWVKQYQQPRGLVILRASHDPIRHCRISTAQRLALKISKELLIRRAKIVPVAKRNLGVDIPYHGRGEIGGSRKTSSQQEFRIYRW